MTAVALRSRFARLAYIAYACCIWMGLVIAQHSRAAAQACHSPDMHRDVARPFRAAAYATFASYQTRRFSGEYQGYGAALSYTHPWVHAEASLAGYRIARNGLVDRGLGDLALDVRGAVYRNEHLSTGLELAATLPTGDDEIGLGMGHVMLMPGAWLAYESGAVSLTAQLAYGRALASSGGGHAHHGGTGALVNPMNRSELEHAVTLAFRLSDQLFAGGRLFGAIPVAAMSGEAREAAAIGLVAHFGPAVVHGELQLPLQGAPFQLRTVLSAGAVF